MRALASLFRLVLARVRRRPGRWLLTILGLALTTAFAVAVAAESVIAGDQAARSELVGLPQARRAVTVSYADVVNRGIEQRARRLLETLHLRAQTEVVLLNPVRLSGVVVRPAAVSPLGSWVTPDPLAPQTRCLPVHCPVLLAGGKIRPRVLAAPDVRVLPAGLTAVRSAVPLGFTPGQPRDQPPTVLTGDVAGLEHLAGLSGLYRTHSWVGLLPTRNLHSWQLGALAHRLADAQATLLASADGFSLSAPFAALSAARTASDAAPDRLLLVAGGSVAALALFVVLAVAAVRRDIDAELRRLDLAGARVSHRVLFVGLEAALTCAAAFALGGLLGLLCAVVEASAAGEPVGGVLDHSLLTPVGLGSLGAGWLSASALVASLLLLRSRRMADVLAAAAVAVLAVVVTEGHSGKALTLLLVPLACLAAGILIYRICGTLLRGAERLARRGPVLARLALVGLARSRRGPALAVACVALSTALGVFALAYRATLTRSAADQAANQVPLDARVTAGQDFTSPFQLASPRQWQAVSGGQAFAVRRTEASFVTGASSITIPALGVPAQALALLHGWRVSDGSATLPVLAHRLTAGFPRAPAGPRLPRGSRELRVQASAQGIAVALTAELRRSDGSLARVGLGQTRQRRATLEAALPPGARSGSWELAGLQTSEPAGLEATIGHQNAENPAAATRFSTTLRIRSLEVRAAAGRLANIRTSDWIAVGAASAPRQRPTGLDVRFSASGQPGLIRPPQPSDGDPLPVLVDPATAARAGASRQLALTIDGLPVGAGVVGVLSRFPTIPTSTSGFVVADEQDLADALDSQLPGQGAPDELWVSTRDPSRLRAALATPRLRQLSGSFRIDVERRLQAAPVARAALGTLAAAAALGAGLAVIGLLASLLGSARDPRVEADLRAQGAGPRALRNELRLRLLLAGVLGLIGGAATGVLLTRLAVAVVRAVGSVSVPTPPAVPVEPWAALTLWILVLIAVLAGAAWLSTFSIVGRDR